MLKANNTVSNVHCTIMRRAATTANADLDCQKHTTHQPVKTSAHYIAHPTIEDEWNASQQDKALRAKETTEVEAQRAIDKALRETQIQEEIRMRSFSSASNLHSFHFVATHYFIKVARTTISLGWR